MHAKRKPSKTRQGSLLKPGDVTANGLLATLPAQEIQQILPHLEDVSLGSRQVIYEPGEAIPYVYFSTGASFVKLIPMKEGPSPEAGLVGRDGMVCHSAILGLDASPFHVIVQNPGRALRFPLAAFRDALGRCPVLHGLLNRYVEAFLIQVAYSAACNSIHSLEQRCARWLLMSHDQTEPDPFHLTQEFLAQLLGANRVSVTEVAGRLQSAGLIRYQRGKVIVTDRSGLEASVCECYRHIRAAFRSLLPADRVK